MEARKTLSMLGALAGGAFLARAAWRQLHAITLRDRVVLVTGARGLALVLARQLVAEGARVALCARDEPELRRGMEDLRERGGRVVARVCDITDREEVRALVAIVEEHWGRVDVLINNAGVIQVGPMETMTLADYEEAMRTHFWAPLYLMLEVLPGMRKRRHGRIVNISSIGGKVSLPHLLPYCASKFALTGLSEGMRAELAKDNVLVTTVCPGLMRTGSPPNAFFKSQNRKEYAWFSLGDALPGLSTSAEGAARRILRACKRGDAEVILTLPAQAGARFHGVFPALTADILGIVNGLLPAPGGIGTRRVRGMESFSAVSPSWATALSDRASVRNNELRKMP